MPGDSRDPLIESRIESRIDAALRSYAEPPAVASDPRTAAAAILERARQAQRRRRSWWFWAIPAGAAATVAIVVLLWALHTPSSPRVARIVPPAPPAMTSHSTTPALPPTVRATHRPGRLPVHRPRPYTAPLPEQAVFPTPAPLSRQEQALLVFTHVAPPAVRQAVIDEQSSWADEAHMLPSSPIHPISQSDRDQP